MLQIDVADERFSALYTSHLYNVDPSSQDYKKTKSMQKIIDEKQRRIQSSEGTSRKLTEKKRKPDEAVDSTKTNIDSLVESIKAKTLKLTSKPKHKRSKML